ncbi:Uncharacterized protein TCM_028807 [Theobroma cacao]|uniref:Uncharacterized protein n=1 Tax=Theobroma cacao TaxID=3641 RepID=A0A061GID8_THECC|nr:Uncharacterized protein TCM_028807 [Theobroma cacao]
MQPKTRTPSKATTKYDVFDETMVRQQTSLSRSCGRARAARCAQNVEPNDVPTGNDYKEGRNDHLTGRNVTLEDLAASVRDTKAQEFETLMQTPDMSMMKHDI